jgi:hypothetical protein
VALPTDLTSLVVNGTYLDPSGAPLAGHITFTPSAQLTDSTGTTVIPAYPKQYNLSASGKFTTDALVATDNADITPANWTYLVTLALQNLPTTSWNAQIPAAPFSFTATNATPCVFTAAGSAYSNGSPVKLAGGSLPAGFTAGTTYFVVSASGTSFSLAATSGGSAIASTSTGSGTVSTAAVDVSSLSPVFSQLAALQYAELLLPTSVQSGSITAAAGQLVLVTTASGNATVSMPTGVEAGSQVGVKMVVLGGSNTVAISCTGTDKFNVAGGGTTLTLSMLDQGMGFIYTGSVWVVANDDVPLGQLDARYMTNLSQTAVKTANYTAAANQLVPCNTSAGGFTVTLPTAPAAGTLAGVAMSGVSGVGVNTLTAATGGSDVFDITGGGTTSTLTLLHQAVLWEYNSGVWAKVSSADPYLQVAQARQGTWYLDQFAGTDDQKMTSALTALFAAGGGTVRLSPRAHSFAGQWATSYVNGVVTTVRIVGAGASQVGAVTINTSGPTTCTMTYAAGAGQMDFQHIGTIEITGIRFVDTTGSVPFFFASNATPNIHDCAFTGGGGLAACTKDAIVLGGQGNGPTGDTAKYNGYNGFIERNYFDTIRQWVVFGGGCNGVVVTGNNGNELCGMAGNWGAPFRFNGNSSHGNTANFIHDNYVPLTGYGACFNGTGGYAGRNVIGPNVTWDASGVVYAILDSTCQANFIHDTTWRTASSSFVAYTTEPAGSQSTALSVNGPNFFQQPLISNADLIVRFGSVGPKTEGASGDRAWFQSIHNGSIAAPGFTVTVQPGTTVTDGSAISGSNVVTSLTAAFASGDTGVFITASGVIPANTYIRWTVAPSSPGFVWTASVAYVAGQVITPVTANGHLYQCTTGGTSGTSQPSFPTGGGTVADGTVVWQDLGAAATAAILSQNATSTNAATTVSFGRPSGSSSLMTKFMNHHIIGSGGAPAYAAQAGAGTGATATVTGTDIGHIVTLTTGTGSLVPAILVKGTPANSFSGSAQSGAYAITPGNAAAAGLGLYGTFASNLWNISCANSPAPSTQYIFNVTMIG